MRIATWSWTVRVPRRWIRHRSRCRARRSSASGASSTSSALTRAGASAVLKSAVISGSFCAAGDILSQIIASMFGDGRWKMDWMRVGRMTGFGLVFYGPFQHVWYRALDARFPRTIAADFMAKVVLNQIVLGPIVISTSFIWTMTLTNKMKELPVKFQRDFVATMTNGWKLWIPAAVANFKLIPIESQVLFMSFVSLCWTAYLGYQSNKNLTQHSIPATDEKA